MSDKSQTTERLDLVSTAKAYLANNAAESGADVIIESLCREVEQLREEVDWLKSELRGAADNKFYDQRDAYFEGLKDGRQ